MSLCILLYPTLCKYGVELFVHLNLSCVVFLINSTWQYNMTIAIHSMVCRSYIVVKLGLSAS